MHTHRLLTRYAILLLVCLTLAPLRAAKDKASDDGTASPDGRFRLQGNDAGNYEILDKKTGKAVKLGDVELVSPINDVIATVWFSDSRHFALNQRAGARYNSTALYEWTGDAFRELPSPEDKISDLLEADRTAQIKAQKLPKNIYVRRIWDVFRTMRWTDARTVEVYASSLRLITIRDTEDEVESAVSGVFTLRLGKDGILKVIGQRKATKTEKEA